MYECREKINMKKYLIILSNSDYLYRHGFLTQHDDKNGYRDITDYNTIKTLLYKFYEMRDEEGEAVITYRPTKNNSNGRVFSTQFSLQGISRRIRHTICDGLVDLDMKNAHPTFLLRLCKQHNLPHLALQHYIEHRDCVLQELMNTNTITCREDGKVLILQIINGGNHLNIEWPEWLSTFYFEMKNVREQMKQYYPSEYKLAETVKGKDGFNINGTALNYVLCTMERTVLDAMISYARSHDHHISALCHDGFMLTKKKGVDYHKIAQELTDHCGITIVVKEMDEPIDLTGLSLKSLDSPCKEYDRQFINEVRKTMRDCWSPLNKALMFLKSDPNISNKFKYSQGRKENDGTWYEILFDGRWSETNEPLELNQKIAMVMYNIMTKLMLLIEKEIKKEKDKEKKAFLLHEFACVKDERCKLHNGVSLGPLRSSMKYYILDNQFGSRIDDKAHLFAFDNGVYDLIQRRFRGLEPTDYIQKSAGYNLDMTSNTTKREFLIRSLKSMFVHTYAKRQSLKVMYPEDDPEERITPEDIAKDIQGEENFFFLMKVFASCLFGGNLWQKMYIMIGNGCNGKSVIVSFIKKMLGMYAQILDISALTKSKKGANETSDLPKTRGARAVFANESSHTDTLQDELIKTLTGCDPVVARSLFSNTITFVPQFKLFMLTNHAPKIGKMDDAIQRRIQLIYFPFKFFDSEDDPLFDRDEKNKTHFLGKDPHLSDRLMDCCNEFFLYLLDIYYESVQGLTSLEVPTEQQAFTNDYFMEQNKLKIFLENNYVFTTDDKIATGSNQIMMHYNRACNDTLNNKTFPEQMRRLKHNKKTTMTHTHYYLRLKSED